MTDRGITAEQLNRRAHPVALLLLYLALVFIGGALVAPWLYFAAQKAAHYSSAFQFIAHSPFHRFVHRALLVFAIAGLWPFCRLAGMNWGKLGLRFSGKFWLRFSRGEWKQFGRGLVIGFASLAWIVVLALASGKRTIHMPPDLLFALVAAVGTAFGVATVEELIFRGVLFGSLKSVGSWFIALLLSSMIYALVHFFSKPAAPAEVTWLSGFFILKEMLRGFLDLQLLIPGFINLTIAGAILTLAYQWTGTLAFSIGLHAGWIFWLKIYQGCTARSPEANEWLWGTERLVDGWAAMVVLFATLVFVAQWLRRRRVDRK